MRTNLKVPYAEKDEAKKRGARWDAALETAVASSGWMAAE